MHAALVEEIVKVCRQREKDGDCPTVDLPGKETLEFTILELVRQRDAATSKALRTLAEGLLKFAPDLVSELAARWAKMNSAGDDFLKFLSEYRPTSIEPKP